MSDWLCEDCGMFLTFGELPADSTPERDNEIMNGSCKGFLTGEEDEFSREPCCNCGTYLAGKRFEIEEC